MLSTLYTTLLSIQFCILLKKKFLHKKLTEYLCAQDLEQTRTRDVFARFGALAGRKLIRSQTKLYLNQCRSKYMRILKITGILSPLVIGNYRFREASLHQLKEITKLYFGKLDPSKKEIRVMRLNIGDLSWKNPFFTTQIRIMEEGVHLRSHHAFSGGGGG